MRTARTFQPRLDIGKVSAAVNTLWEESFNMKAVVECAFAWKTRLIVESFNCQMIVP